MQLQMGSIQSIVRSRDFTDKLSDDKVIREHGNSYANEYRSPSQKARVLTESWVRAEVYCPACFHKIDQAPNNQPVLDFFCSSCGEGYELKSKKSALGAKIVDGAYATMIERLQSKDQPNFFLLRYSAIENSVIDFFVIPKHFMAVDIIEKRKPLPSSARRHGWVGCNILLRRIPQSGRIAYVKDRNILPPSEVRNNWEKTLFLRDKDCLPQKSWILDTMSCIERLDKRFSLKQMYEFADHLRALHPGNSHVKEKIRQQLQVLRDRGYIRFLGDGTYER